MAINTEETTKHVKTKYLNYVKITFLSCLLVVLLIIIALFLYEPCEYNQKYSHHTVSYDEFVQTSKPGDVIFFSTRTRLLHKKTGLNINRIVTNLTRMSVLQTHFHHAGMVVLLDGQKYIFELVPISKKYHSRSTRLNSFYLNPGYVPIENYRSFRGDMIRRSVRHSINPEQLITSLDETQPGSELLKNGVDFLFHTYKIAPFGNTFDAQKISSCLDPIQYALHKQGIPNLGYGYGPGPLIDETSSYFGPAEYIIPNKK